MRSRTLRVTMECAGNGRAQVSPRYPSIPWVEDGVSTAEWTGVPLREVLGAAGLRPETREVVFHGADRGIDRNVEHSFSRSLVPDDAMHEDVLLAWAMNGEPLPPRHGFPLRLVVPRWYGMASVKWLERIEAIDAAVRRRAAGAQLPLQAGGGRSAACLAVSCASIRCSRRRASPTSIRAGGCWATGRVGIVGRAWSGEAPVARVEFAVDGAWRDAELDAPAGDLRLARLARGLGRARRRARALLPRDGRSRQRAAARAALGPDRIRQQRGAARRSARGLESPRLNAPLPARRCDWPLAVHQVLRSTASASWATCRMRATSA